VTSVTIAALVFERGEELPSVCAVTGGRPDGLRKVVLTRTPLWVWLLIPVPLFFLLGYVFATERIVGRLPLRDSVHRRRRLLTTGRWIALGAVFFVLGAVIFTSLAGPFAALAIVPLIAFGLLSSEREKLMIKGRILPGDRVELFGVAPRFAAAVDQLQPFLG
jgi:hypothetical protein